jgi:hypothetical protein
LKLAARFKSLQFEAVPRLWMSCARCGQRQLDSQTLAAFGAASVDHSAATAGFHANQKTVGAGAFDLGRLVSAFHFEILKGSMTA